MVALFGGNSESPTPTGLAGALQGSTSSSNLGNWGTGVAGAIGITNPTAKSASGQLQSSVNAQNASTQNVLSNLNQQNQGYENAMQTASSNYLGSLGSATSQYENNLNQTNQAYQSQASDSKSAYTNTVLPALSTLVGQTGANAQGAMTLQQAEDPNNSVAKAVQGQYNTAAQGIQNQGTADYGVLAGLGSEATANTIGGMGMPVTGGQLQALQGANLSQAGQAQANAQNTANNLKIQGLQAGQNQSNWAYGAGQAAIGTAAQMANNYGAADTQMNQIQNQYTGEEAGVNQDYFGAQAGLAGTTYNQQSGLAGMNEQINQSEAQQQLGANNQLYGSQQGLDNAQIAAANAQQQAKLGALGTVIGGTAGYFSGSNNGGGQQAATSNAYSAANTSGAGGGGGGAMGNAGQGAALGQAAFNGFSTPQGTYSAPGYNTGLTQPNPYQSPYQNAGPQQQQRYQANNPY